MSGSSRGPLGIGLGAVALYTGAMATAYFTAAVPKHRAETAWFIYVALVVVVGALSWARDDQESETGPGSTTPAGLLFPLLGALTLLLYLPAFRIGLLSDDFSLIDRATRHDYWSASSSGFFRPVPLLSWAVLLAAFGRFGTVALHALNVFLHAANATLVVRLAERLALPKLAAVLAGVLFVCFPASVEPVAWASGLQDVLLTTAALVFVLGATQGIAPWAIAVSMAALIVALGTKETAIAIPVLALPLVSNWRTPRQLALPIAGLLLAFGYALWRLMALGTQQHQTAWPSRYFAKEMLSRAFGTLGLPFTGAEVHRFAALGIGFGWLFLILSLALVVRAQNRRLLTTSLKAALWIVAAVAPVYTFFYITPELQGSRYLYLAACGWSVLVALLISSSRGARQVVYVGGGAVAVVWACAIRAHLLDWEQAATVRDAVVSSAVKRLTVTSCRPLGFSDLPDSVGGAYVFRNGFIDALAAEGVPPGAAMLADRSGSCVLRWNGREFQ